MARVFRVSHAEIRLQGMGEQGPTDYFRSALEQSWVAGVEVTRYGRTWRLSKWTRPDGRLWAGRMGFVKEGELSTLTWDAFEQDFVRGEASSGIVVPFVVSEDYRLVSFQLLSGEVRPTTVTSNLQRLLSAEGTHFWRIRPLVIRQTLEEWLTSVHRISEFDAVLTYPNPDWTGRAKVENLMTSLEAYTLQIKAKAAGNSSIDVESDWFRQSMDHVRFGYGKATLAGPDSYTGDESKYVETPDGGTVPAIDRVIASDDAVEVTVDELIEKQFNIIGRQQQGGMARHEGEVADEQSSA